MGKTNSEKPISLEQDANLTMHSKSLRPLAISAVLVLCATMLTFYGARFLRGPAASEVFRRHVLDPIPASVTDLKADQTKSSGGYGYVLRFGVNRSDLEQILASQSVPLREARLDYSKDGMLSFVWKGPSASLDSCSFSLYGKGNKPSWFDLASWEGPDVYACFRGPGTPEEPDTVIVIYNATIRRAYFMVYEYGRT